MIHFDFDDRYQDEAVVGNAIPPREGVALSVIVHALLIASFLYGPRLPMFQPDPDELARRQAELEQQRKDRPATFVFVQPKVEMKAVKPPPRAEASDLDRQAKAIEPAPIPENPLPFNRGNSVNRVEAADEARARGAEAPQPVSPDTARVLPPTDEGLPRPPDRPRTRAVGALGEAIRNFQKYVDKETFNNPQGGQNSPGSEIQFDTKGVEFGPWIRRFVTEVKRNWFIPLAAMNFKGHVVLQFNIWKDGHITDVAVVQPASIESFNIAAVNAITHARVDPLPPEYPSEKAFFTVTFYYNEQPLGQ